jgi:hypothetical protein
VTNEYVTFDRLPWIPDHLAWVMADTQMPPSKVLGVLCPSVRLWAIHFINKHGQPTSLAMGEVFPYDPGPGIRSSGLGAMPGTGLYQLAEIISDVDDAGQEYVWRARVFSPAAPVPLWTPARLALSQKRLRITRAKNAYQARMRALGVSAIEADDVDPLDVYERDGWTCQLCLAPVNRTLKWPDPMSVTLDHVRPVTRGGTHNAENLQTAHWVCNIQKGNRA